MNILEFVNTQFRNAPTNKLYGIIEHREPHGKGPHFDVYQHLIDPNYFYVGVYNISGTCSRRVAILPDDDVDWYADKFPIPTEDAYEARRLLSRVLFETVTPTVSELNPDDWFVLDQNHHVVHEIIPVDKNDPGNYMKIVVAKDEISELALIDAGFSLVGELFTNSLRTPKDGRRQPVRRPGDLKVIDDLIDMPFIKPNPYRPWRKPRDNGYPQVYD